MNAAEWWTVLLGTLAGLGVSTLFVLALFIGFCVLLGLRKLRPTSRGSLVVRSLDEVVGEPLRYLPPDAPRGRTDQLGGAQARP
jgi:hypothetical protein